MEAILDAIQDVVAAEPTAEAPPVSAQPDDAVIETQVAQEITTLWSEHSRLSADRKVTSKELRLLRARLAQRLHEMKALLARPGRGGEWRGWLRERGIPRSTADRLVSRHTETQSSDNGNVLTGAISNSPEDSAEKLANTVWQRFRSVLATDDAVIRFIRCIAELSGVGHERRADGLMIFSPEHKAADGVIGTGVNAEATCPAPLPPEGGDTNLTDSPAAVPDPQPSCETATATEGPAADTTATPLAAEPVATAADAGGSDAA